MHPVEMIQGPLAGVSNWPFRELVWKYSQPSYTYTEMISAKTLIYQAKEHHKRFVAKSPREGALCFQLSGNDTNELGEAVKRVTEYGADIIDLNCGCPVKKIRGKQAGSKLLSDPLHLYHLISVMKKNTHLPVSVKIRIDGNSNDRFNAEVAKAITDAGADKLIVHGRHWTEHYETSVNYDQIRYFVEMMPIPVIGNGDVACLQSFKKMLATGCSGVMIGRAGVGQPWLIQQLLTELNGKDFKVPSLAERKGMLINHASNLCDLLGNERFALLQMRKLIKYYFRGYFLNEINSRYLQAETLKALVDLISNTTY